MDGSTATAWNFGKHFDKDEPVRRDLLFDVPTHTLPEPFAMFELTNGGITGNEGETLDLKRFMKTWNECME